MIPSFRTRFPACAFFPSSVSLPRRLSTLNLSPTIRQLLSQHSRSFPSTPSAPSTPPKVTINGWVRYKREKKSISFFEIYDGSTVNDLQCVATPEQTRNLTNGTSVSVLGMLVDSPGKGQAKEFQVEKTTIIGASDPENFPIQRHALPPQILRKRLAHFRSRTKETAAILRLRDRMNWGVQRFFRRHEFFQINTPVLTSNDCEGGGEAFLVSIPSSPSSPTPVMSPPSSSQSPLPNPSSPSSPSQPPLSSQKPLYLSVSTQLHLEAFCLGLSRVYSFSPCFRAESSDTNRHLSEFWMLEAEVAWIGMENKGKDVARSDQKKLKEGEEERGTDGLEEIMNLAQRCLEDSLAEVWKPQSDQKRGRVEGRLDGSKLEQEEEDNLGFLLSHQQNKSRQGHLSSVSSSMQSHLSLLDQFVKNSRIAQLAEGASQSGKEAINEDGVGTNIWQPWPRITYTRALEILQKAWETSSPASLFKPPPPKWGDSIKSEHEKWLASEYFKGPVFITDYPKKIKPFYMADSLSSPKLVGDDWKTSEDKATVACFDLLVPGLGELAGGSLRFWDPPSSSELASEDSIPWYSELRRWGSVPHGGFGIGWERWLAWVVGGGGGSEGAGINVRDVIPFPRVVGEENQF